MRARRLLQLELAHVALAQLERQARARSRAIASIAGEQSIPITGLPVSRAIAIATRPLPTASSTIGPSASRASQTYQATSSVMSAAQMS